MLVPWQVLRTGLSVAIYCQEISDPNDITTQKYDSIAVVAAGGEPIFNVTIPHDVISGFVNRGRNSTSNLILWPKSRALRSSYHVTNTCIDAHVRVTAKIFSGHASSLPLVWNEKLTVET